MATAQKSTQAESAPAPVRARRKPYLLIAVGALALIGGGAVAVWFTVRDDAAESPAAQTKKQDPDKKAKRGKKEPAPALYLPLDPPFVVNARDGGVTRFLQVTIEVMARDLGTIEEVKKHSPLIRNNLVLLLSSLPAGEVNTREGKEKLRAAALAEVQKVMQEQTGRAGVEALYFTSFVMQ